MYADRFRIAPYGLFGGSDGMTGRCEVLRDGKVIHIKSKASAILCKGDILTIHTAGGGGYGPIGERSPAAVARDVRQGFLSGASAEVVYGTTG